MTSERWSNRAISMLPSAGIISGYPEGTFRPGLTITRTETMTLINSVLKRKVDEEGLLDEAKQWSDNPEGTWYYYEILEATNSHDYTRCNEVNLVENWTAITNG